MYKYLPSYIYIEDEKAKLVEKKNIEIKESSVLPEEEISTSTTLKTEKLNSLLKKGYRLSIGIEDPMTEKVGVRLAMNTLYQEGKNYLWK